MFCLHCNLSLTKFGNGSNYSRFNKPKAEVNFPMALVLVSVVLTKKEVGNLSFFAINCPLTRSPI